MKNDILFDYPNNLQIIFDKLAIHNIRPIIIGGYVRDFLLNIKSKDIDIELYGVSSLQKVEEILKEFGNINSVGKSFGVCKLSLLDNEIDFTLPREDNKISSGHKGFDIRVNSELDFKTATSRRDFTINTIAYDVQRKEILNPFGGIDDLKNKILRAVNIKTFAEDPLRVLRAVGFSSRFNFNMDTELFLLCKKMCDENVLEELAKERIYSEIKKILLKSSKPSSAFFMLKELNALKYLTPLESLNNNDFSTVLKALDCITKSKTNSNKTNIILMLAILCYKFNTKQTIKFILNLTSEKNLLKKVLILVNNNFKPIYNDSELLHLAAKVNIEDFLIFNKAINNSYDDKIFDTIKIRAKELNILNEKMKPLLRGKDIMACGIEPSQRYSTILKSAYEAQLNLEISNYEEAKKWLEKYLVT
ncbi:CCA tRNA nucleotidyltransferase [Sulfurimonas sp.]